MGGLARLIATRIASRRAGLLASVFYGVFTTVYYPKMLAANTEVDRVTMYVPAGPVSP